MSAEHHYRMCCQGIGRAVELRMHDGTVHRGIIDRVDREHVYLRPMGRGQSFGGYSYGWGWGWRPGLGLATGFALGAIASLAFLPFFWW